MFRKTFKSLATLLIMGVPFWIVALGIFGQGSDAGTLLIRTEDAKAEVWLGDERAGESAAHGRLRKHPLPAGRHRVRVVSEGVVVVDRRVRIQPGQQTVVEARKGAGSREQATLAAAPAEPIPGLEAGARLFPSQSALLTGVGTAEAGRFLLTTGNDGTLTVYVASTQQRLHIIQAHEGRVIGMTVLADGRRAVTAGDDHRLRVWDLASGVAVHTITTGVDSVPVCMAASRDGRYVAVASLGGTVQIFELSSGKELQRRHLAPDGPGSLAFLPDGSAVLLGQMGVPDREHPVYVWDVATGRDRMLLHGHRGTVWTVAALPDGRRAVTGGGDHTLRVWDLSSGKQLACFENHPGVVFSAAVSPDGRFALTGTGHQWLDGWSTAEAYGAHVWDLEQFRPVGRLDTPGPLRCVAFSADGTHVIAAGEDRQLRDWSLPDLSRPATAAFARKGRAETRPEG